MLENLVGCGRVAGEFLDSEVGNGAAEMRRAPSEDVPSMRGAKLRVPSSAA
jgi:hypothetical protein